MMRRHLAGGAAASERTEGRSRPALWLLLGLQCRGWLRSIRSCGCGGSLMTPPPMALPAKQEAREAMFG